MNMEQLMTYLILYLVIGAGVAVAMALVPAGETNRVPEDIRESMLDAYFFIGLAWPISVTAFVYGSVTHIIDRSFQGNKQ